MSEEDIIFVKHKKDGNNLSIWSRFLVAIDGDIAQCKICQSVLKTTGGSTKGLHTHLSTKHQMKIIPDQQPSSSTEYSLNSTHKDSFDDMDTEIFIEEIKSRPELWKNTNVHYHNKSKKRKAWLQVCRVFYEGFDDKDAEEKNELCKKLTIKWNKVKSSYFQSLKKMDKLGETADLSKQYLYAEQLSFLHSTGSTLKSEISLEGNDEYEKEDFEDLNEKPIRQSSIIRSSLKGTRSCMESSLNDIIKRPIPSPVEVSASENGDRLFFESILPSIKDFTEDQKLDFRCEMLNTIKRIRKSSCQQNNECISTNEISHQITSVVSLPSFSTPQSTNDSTRSQCHQSTPEYRPNTHGSMYYPEVILNQNYSGITSEVTSTPTTSNS